MRIMPPTEFEVAWTKLKARHAWLFSGDHIGHGCCPGWLPIIERLCIQLEDIVPREERSRVWFAQTKEKFGTFHAYLNIAPIGLRSLRPDGQDAEREKLYRDMHDLVMRAEQESFELCQWCGGAPAAQRRVGWLLTTACDEHAYVDYAAWSDLA